jgi:hypothetical protein
VEQNELSVVLQPCARKERGQAGVHFSSSRRIGSTGFGRACRLAQSRDQAVRRSRTDRPSLPPGPAQRCSTATFAFDVKYGVTQNLTADFTYNTDFAQVEADEQQVNLTRFSLFFPRSAISSSRTRGLPFGAAAPATSNNGDTPDLFYSRRIGLDAGRACRFAAAGG